MKTFLRICGLAILLAGVGSTLARSQYPSPSPSPSASPASKGAPASPCPDFTPVPYSRYRNFVRTILPPSNFARTFRRTFGHTFTPRESLKDIVDAFSIYGYDYIGNHDGYLLFYRRPLAWLQITSLPPIVAPNGQLLPGPVLPPDLDPEWPAPGIIARTPPFIGAIVLPQSIVAYPCLP